MPSPVPKAARLALLCALALVLPLAAGPDRAVAAEAAEGVAAPVPAAPEGFFGVSGRGLREGDLKPMRGAGVAVYRTLFNFRGARKDAEGFYDWTEFDRLVEMTARHGIELLPLLYGTPSWIHGKYNVPPIYDARARSEWSRLLERLVSRYGPGGLFWKLHPLLPELPIRSWQIWNEPNLDRYWQPGPHPAGYARLLTLSADAITAVDPNATIVAAGVLADPPRRDRGVSGPQYLAALAASPQVRAAADRFAYHPYARGVAGVKRHLVRARRAIDRNGGRGMPLWVTELGWGSDPGSSRLLSKDEPGQALALSRAFKMILRNRASFGVERALWYYWRDHFDPECLWCRSAGLLGNGFRPKPALAAYSALANR